mmetsp:Transcript_15368/g.20370  ORF Transcript_15368/g.20370 Transcript_15368/m.20370 type:complete len:83 (-) Transcript_15368:1095-1343(-)
MASSMRRVFGSTSLRAGVQSMVSSTVRQSAQRGASNRLVAATTSKQVRTMSTMDSMETGTKTYMSLYPEGSTDGGKKRKNVV